MSITQVLCCIHQLSICRRQLHEDTKQLGSHSTDLQRAKVLERRIALQHRYDAWVEVQHLYMPAVAALRLRDTNSASNVIPDARLFLPSEIISTVQCDPLLAACEHRLRWAQAHDTLESLRRHLRLRSHLYQVKDRFVRGQHPNTRARGVIDNVQNKVNTDAKHYRKARDALEVLSNVFGDQMWQRELRQLDDEDVRGMSEGLLMETEGRRTLSWIWRTPGIGSVDSSSENEGVQEGECNCTPTMSAMLITTRSATR